MREETAMVAKGADSAMVWAARLGELCGSAGRGPEAERAFLRAWLDLAGAQAGFLGLCPVGGDPQQVNLGFDGVRLDGLWSTPFPRAAAAQLARAEPVALLAQGEEDDWWPRPGFGEAALLRLLSVVVGQEDRVQAVLVAGWTAEDGCNNGLVEATRLLLPPLERALRRLAEPPVGRQRAAWERSRVPLIFVREDGRIAEVNPAARRKLEIASGDRTLPSWLAGTVASRLKLMQETGEGMGDVTGEHAYLGVSDGRSRFRVGIAPVMDERHGEMRWLLTVEKGGPSLWERVEMAEDTLGLTPRESLVLELLARGMSNRQIGAVAAVKETTVKYHLVSVMRKSGTANRTELLASFYAGDLGGGGDVDEDLSEDWTDQVDLGFATITWGSGGLVRVVIADGVDLTRRCAQLLWNEFESRFDAPVKLYADIAGMVGVAADAVTFFGGRASQRVRACAVRATSAVSRGAVSSYLTDRRPPYPMRLFKREDEALAWLSSLD